MQKIEATSPEASSADITAENITKLRELFPELLTETAKGATVNMDVLKQLVGDSTTTDVDEKYGLNWHGKRRARQIALTPSTGTLRPYPDESVNWATTQNLMIEGDNLEVLKLLQKSYAGKVKLIYIDPPYNTGNDFVYPDNFQDNIQNYLEITGQSTAGQKLTSNAETSGRFHTDWLSMMYPRLKLAKNLLHKDGAIFVSCDDSEVSRVRMIMDEIFGEETHIATFVWKSRQNKDNRTIYGASVDHEYLVSFGTHIRGDARDESQFTNPDQDPRGRWTSANMVGIATADRRPNLHYELKNPTTGNVYSCPEMGWRYDRNTMARLIQEDRIIWPASKDGRPRRKAFLDEFDSAFTGFSTIIGEGLFTRHGTAAIDELFETRIFDFPKPVGLLKTIVEQGSSESDLILDFFAGSGTMGQAVFEINAEKQSHRRFILVQLPEPLSTEDRDQKTAADYCEQLGKPKNIAELTKERLRRAGAKSKSSIPLISLDTGFRVFKLDSSNIKRWDPSPTNISQALIEEADHIISDRGQADIVYEILLKLGLDLAVPIESRTIAGKTVGSIGSGVLMVCLADEIESREVEAIAQGIVKWNKELCPTGDVSCVFRDSAFENDVAKANMAAILEQHGIAKVRSL